jgi:hypothetical protein
MSKSPSLVPPDVVLIVVKQQAIHGPLKAVSVSQFAVVRLLGGLILQFRVRRGFAFFEPLPFVLNELLLFLREVVVEDPSRKALFVVAVIAARTPRPGGTSLNTRAAKQILRDVLDRRSA